MEVMMSRRTRERAREDRSQDKPVDWVRLRQKFTSLTSRRNPVLQELILIGDPVDAQTPEEAARKLDEQLIKKTRNEPEN